jgi:DNA-binding IclR family transcriptional regulator
MSKRTIPNPPARNNSSSLRRALSIVLHLADPSVDARGLGLGELATALEINKSTLLRLLGPLTETRLVERNAETGRYRLGWRTAQLGQAYLERLDLRAAAHDVLTDLTGKSGETTHLVIADLPDVVYLDKVDPSRPVLMYSRIGNRQPAYRTAVGKAILCHSDIDVVRGVAARGMPARTPHTRTDLDALLADLELTRDRGFAVDDIENEPDIRCVAAPVFDHTGAVDCAISISGPASRVTPERIPELGRLVVASAEEISRRRGAPPTRPA